MKNLNIFVVKTSFNFFVSRLFYFFINPSQFYAASLIFLVCCHSFQKLNSNSIFFFRNTPSPDEQCLRAQSLLHPVCAQQPPDSDVIGGKQVQPVCHTIARGCKQNPDCRSEIQKLKLASQFEKKIKLPPHTKNIC